MMGSVNEDGAHPLSLPQREEMETLILDDPLTLSNSNYTSVMTTLCDFSNNHPLLSSIVAEPVDSVPLLSSEDPVSSKHGDLSSHYEDYDYSDVFVSPMINGGAGGGSNGIGSLKGSVSRSESLSSLGSNYLSIVVSNPQKEHEVSSNLIVPGANTFVSYLVTTKTNMRGFGGSEFSVRRRVRDVVTLADRLSESYRGYFIPLRPEKSVVESQVMHKQEFVEQRRAALEKYLRKLAAYPVIRMSDELGVFLQVRGKRTLGTSMDVASRMLDGSVKLPKQLFGESKSVVDPHESVQPAKGGRDLLRLFKELKQSVTNDWGNPKPTLVEENKEFLEKKEKLYDFEHRIIDASKQFILFP